MPRAIVTVLGLALVAGATARADLAPVSEPDKGPRRPAAGFPRLDLPRSHPADDLARLAAGDLDPRARGIFAEEPAQRELTEETPRLHVLADRQNGVSLCLYALLGLGLYKAAPCVKRLAWGGLPEWYHEGGPFQIGASRAVPPDCLCPLVLCGFAPPQSAAEDPRPEYRSRDVVHLWRKSQFRPTVLGPRGPPSRPEQL